MTDFLPYGRQEISEQDIEAVVAALRAPMITQGPRVAEFEKAFADYVGAKHAVAVSSGTAALHTAASAAGIGPGDRVAVPPITFASSANCALFQGAEPVFADISLDTFNVDPANVAAVGPLKAAVPVSMAGLPADIDGVRAAAPGAVIIEDGCHSLGAHRNGKPVGGPGGADLTCFSLHPLKHITTGEGGVVTTESDEFAEHMRLFRTHGIDKQNAEPESWEGGWYMEMKLLGFNYRITDFQCALGSSQLKNIEAWVVRRNEIAAEYREKLAGIEGLALPPEAPNGSRHGYHLFVVRVLESVERRLAVFEGLREAGIGVQVHYIPIYRMPHYRSLGYTADGFDNSELYYRQAISLPIFPGMNSGDVDRVVAELKRLLTA